MGCAGLTSLMCVCSTLRLAGFKGSAANVVVPDAKAHLRRSGGVVPQWIRAVLDVKGELHNIGTYWSLLIHVVHKMKQPSQWLYQSLPIWPIHLTGEDYTWAFKWGFWHSSYAEEVAVWIFLFISLCIFLSGLTCWMERMFRWCPDTSTLSTRLVCFYFCYSQSKHKFWNKVCFLFSCADIGIGA